jgi:hypothetical protein
LNDDIRYVLGGVLVLGLIVSSVVAARRRPAFSLRQTLLVALGIRVVVAALAYGLTPNDVTVYFHQAGLDVLHGHDPLTTMRQYQWNFLPFFPYVFLAEIKTGLPWQAASKLVPILSDLANVYLVGLFARDEDAGTARLIYALSPVAVLVAAWHGQVEPTAITLGLLGFLLARSAQSARSAQTARAVTSGAAVGLAISSKTWPVLFAPGLLRGLPPRRWPQALVAVGTVIAFWFVIAVTALGDRASKVVHLIGGYRSLTGVWGWSGLLRYAHRVNIGYGGTHGHIDAVQHAGTVATVLVLGAVLVLFYRRSPAELTAALLLGFVATTAGFGPQYLYWPVPLLCAIGVGRRMPALYMGLTAVYEGLYYLHASPTKHVTSGWPGATLEILSLAIELVAFLSILVSAHETGHTGPVPQRGSDPAPRLREDAEGDPGHRRDRVRGHRRWLHRRHGRGGATFGSTPLRAPHPDGGAGPVVP